MKILILNYEYPPLGGGAGNITKQLAENFAKQQNNVVVITTGFNDLPETDNHLENLEIIRLNSKRKYLHSSNPIEMLSWMRKSVKYLSVYLKENSFDICLANFSIPGGYVAKQIKNKFKIPYCILSHGHDIPWYYKRQMFVYHLALYFFIKSICKKSLLNFVQTEFMKINIDKFLGKRLVNKNVIISNGVYLTDEVIYDRKDEPFTVIFVGRFVKQKDPLTILKALRRLKKMDISFRLFLIGDGPMRKKMEKFVNKNKLENTIFTGWVSQTEVQKYYQKSHVMVTPSLAEGMSVANMEALSAGVFLIATPVSGNKEMLSCFNNGALIDSGNYNEIANQLQKFYFQQFLPKNLLAQNSALEFVQKYNWQVISEQYIEAFRKCLN
ncbi:MAG: glycosyltransferase family 4 protein [Bacteroidia bacterium]|nr:glycosyltransferase family 4 protein [Bacteroidia bacterium]